MRADGPRGSRPSSRGLSFHRARLTASRRTFVDEIRRNLPVTRENKIINTSPSISLYISACARYPLVERTYSRARQVIAGSNNRGNSVLISLRERASAILYISIIRSKLERMTPRQVHPRSFAISLIVVRARCAAKSTTRPAHDCHVAVGVARSVHVCVVTATKRVGAIRSQKRHRT